MRQLICSTTERGIFRVKMQTMEPNENGQKKLEIENGLKEHNLEQTTSDFGALLHIVKSSMGAGVLAMPYAFKNSGLILGVIASGLTGLAITHAMITLVNCAQKLGEKSNRPRMSYADTVEYALIHGYQGKLKEHAYKARCFVNFFLFLTIYGVITYYVLLISSSFKQVIDRYADINVNIRLYTLGIIILIYPAGIVSPLKYLVPFSAVANVILLFSLGLILREIFRNLPDVGSRLFVESPAKWPLFLGTSFVSMEGIGTILPLENEMRNPNHLTHFPGLLYIGMLFSVFVNTLIGFFGYLKYGSLTRGVISLNLPEDGISESVKVAVALVVLFTYGLQMTAPMKVAWDGIKPMVKNNSFLYYYGLRSLLILGNVLIAAVLPSLGGIISLMGSMGFSIVGFFVPAFIDLLCLPKDKHGIMKWRIVKNIIMILFSIVCACIGVYCSILEMMKDS